MWRLRLGLNLLKSKFTARKMPFQINIHVTDACNLRCRYCYIDFQRPHPDMPFSVLKRVIREARQLNTERISIEGGEPLLRNDIGEIVDCIADLGIECNINTNGVLLLNRIKDIKKVSMVSVSLDGEKEIHDRMRGSGSFDKAINAIKIAKEHGIKVNVLSVLNKANRNSVEFMIKLAKELGVTWVPNSLFFVGGRQINAEEAARYVIDDDEYKKLLNELAEKKFWGAPIAWSLETFQYAKDWPQSYIQSNFFESDKKPNNGFKPIKCQAARYFCVIQTNGDVYSCDPLLGHSKTANCFELGLREAFRRLDTGGCVACNSLVCTEYNYLFSLRPLVILNQIATYGKAKQECRRP